MYCVNCGVELPDEAGFCWKCGKSQRTVGTGELEYCQIRRRGRYKQSLIGGRFFDWYEAHCGPELIRRSEEWETKNLEINLFKNLIPFHDLLPNDAMVERDASERREVFERFIESLKDEGWEPIVQEDGSIEAMRRPKTP